MRTLARSCTKCDTAEVIKVAFIGAGSVEFTRNVVTDLCGYPELAGGLDLALHDVNAERLAHAQTLATRIVAQTGSGATVTASADRRPVLDGARYVINEIQVGGYDATRLDFDIPARYGVRQTIADTLGIGGIFRGLRTIPVVIGLAEDMHRLCPDAYLLNYTNPMAMLPWAVYEGTPFTNVFGLCHSVRDTHAFLAGLVGAGPGGRRLRHRGVQPPGVRAALRAPGRGPCTRGCARSSTPRPSCSGGSGSSCSAGSATSPPSPASTPPSTCRGSCATTTRSSGSASSSATTWPGPRRTCASWRS